MFSVNRPEGEIAYTPTTNIVQCEQCLHTDQAQCSVWTGLKERSLTHRPQISFSVNRPEGEIAYTPTRHNVQCEQTWRRDRLHTNHGHHSVWTDLKERSLTHRPGTTFSVNRPEGEIAYTPTTDIIQHEQAWTLERSLTHWPGTTFSVNRPEGEIAYTLTRHNIQCEQAWRRDHLHTDQAQRSVWTGLKGRSLTHRPQTSFSVNRPEGEIAYTPNRHNVQCEQAWRRDRLHTEQT